MCTCLHANTCLLMDTHACTHNENSAYKALDSRGTLGPCGRTYTKYKCSQVWLPPKRPAGKEDKVMADIRSLPSGSCCCCNGCCRKRWEGETGP